MKYRAGATRIVFILKNVVIKIPRFNYTWNLFVRGLLANMEERKAWLYNSGKYERGHSHLLCPVLWSSTGGWILIMRKADVFPQAHWEIIMKGNLIDEHKEYFPGDDTRANYGLLDGKIVKIDYGELDVYGFSRKFKSNDDRS